MPRTRPPIVQIGFNKVGTRSLATLFRANGIRAADWLHGDLAHKAWRRMQAGEDPFADFEGFDAFSDMEDTSHWFRPFVEFYKHYDYIHRHHPDAYFILNIRDRDDWIRSRLKHGRGAYLLAYMIRRYRTLSRADVIRRWEAEWDDHLSAVQAHFAETGGRLLVYDIERDGPEKIAAFLAPDYAIEADALPHRGRTGRKRTWAKVPHWLRAKLRFGRWEP
ncbi:MAG: sulfotransferase [Rubricella sp.]